MKRGTLKCLAAIRLTQEMMDAIDREAERRMVSQADAIRLLLAERLGLKAIEAPIKDKKK